MSRTVAHRPEEVRFRWSGVTPPVFPADEAGMPLPVLRGRQARFVTREWFKGHRDGLSGLDWRGREYPDQWDEAIGVDRSLLRRAGGMERCCRARRFRELVKAVNGGGRSAFDDGSADAEWDRI